MEHCPVRLLCPVHLARNPVKRTLEEVQATLILPRYTDRLLGYRDDNDGSCEGLYWIADYAHSTWCI